MKPTTALLTTALLVTSAASCTTTRVEYLPSPLACHDLPQPPELPVLDRGELWDALGDATYRDLETYVNALWGYADEQAATLNVLCQP